MVNITILIKDSVEGGKERKRMKEEERERKRERKRELFALRREPLAQSQEVSELPMSEFSS